MAKNTLTNFRYTDLMGEPVARLLSSIKGDEAVVPIAHFFDYLEENV
jgi:hypothetical protein